MKVKILDLKYLGYHEIRTFVDVSRVDYYGQAFRVHYNEGRSQLEYEIDKFGFVIEKEEN